MTKIDNSTQSVLAAITAKNSWQPVTTHNRAALPDIIATESSLPPRETKRTKALKKQLHKTKEEKPAKKFEEPNITRLQGREGIVWSCRGLVPVSFEQCLL
ncbi:hypothetical protein [Halocynthiibacter namhaensis]|uniref:hypothetical protein n=1 Tax=Halocynthiibacter namhaensis TaxID=1290553 RepID=UPI00057977EB|nr:hypothetical protein [Halocynthiibacter namhaensis]